MILEEYGRYLRICNRHFAFRHKYDSCGESMTIGDGIQYVVDEEYKTPICVRCLHPIEDTRGRGEGRR